LVEQKHYFIQHLSATYQQISIISKYVDLFKDDSKIGSGSIEASFGALYFIGHNHEYSIINSRCTLKT